jgi:hypothetical protein
MSVQMAVHPAAAARLAGGIFRRQRYNYALRVCLFSAIKTTDSGVCRWLCTLLLQRGWRVEYSAASDSFTACPEGFKVEA